MKWLEANFGGADNVVYAILHLDERPPHIHAIVIPLDEKGKRNYTKYLGGSKYRLSELQDSYYPEVGQNHQLDRGMKESKASHQDIDNFYSMVSEAVTPPELPPPETKTGLFKKGETALEYQQRIAPDVQHAQALASLQNKYNSLKKHFKETKDKLEQKTADYEALEEKYSKMSKDYRALKSASSQVENLQWENKLMYTLLKTLHQSERIEKCRTAHAKGRVSIEEKLIFGKEKSQQENSQKLTTSQRSYTSQNRLIER